MNNVTVVRPGRGRARVAKDEVGLDKQRPRIEAETDDVLRTQHALQELGPRAPHERLEYLARREVLDTLGHHSKAALARRPHARGLLQRVPQGLAQLLEPVCVQLYERLEPLDRIAMCSSPMLSLFSFLTARSKGSSDR